MEPAAPSVTLTGDEDLDDTNDPFPVIIPPKKEREVNYDYVVNLDLAEKTHKTLKYISYFKHPNLADCNEIRFIYTPKEIVPKK